MALSYVSYTGTGAQTDYNVTFAFISRSHVVVLLAGVETSAFTWLSDSQIRFTTAPALSVAIKIKRSTPNTARLVDFQNGSTINADTDLDTDSNQLFYIAQEAYDNTVDVVAPDLSVSTEKIVNLAVTTAKINDLAVTTGKIAEDAVTMAKLAEMAARTVVSNDTASSANPTARLIDDLTVLADGSSTRRDLSARFANVLNAKDYGATGDGVTDDTTAIAAVRTAAIAALPCTIYFPKGTYLFSSLSSFAKAGLTLRGEGSAQTVLKHTGSGTAIDVDAFAGNGAAAPFLNRVNLESLTIEGNTNTTILVLAQGIARSAWRDVNLRVANAATGIAAHFKGVMLCRFESLVCSTDIASMSAVPSEGLRMEAGTRESGGGSVGNCTNNVFVNCYMEGMPIGWRLTGADQSLFVGGSAESNTTYGVLIATGSRFNTFVGCAFESAASTADVSDGGQCNRYLNCYSAKKLFFASTSRGCTVEGGFHERLETEAGATRSRFLDATFNHWSTGSGGFVDGGTGTIWANLWDVDAAAFKKHPQRASITVTASPFSYTNTTGRTIEVLITAGTVSQVRLGRDGDFALKSPAVPGSHILSHGDVLEVTWSVAPTLNYIPHAFSG